MNRNRVLFVVDSFDRFGATRQLELLTREVNKDRDVHISVLGSSNQPTTLPEHCGVQHFLGTTPCPQTARSLTRAGLRLRKLIKRLKPEIVHAWCQPAERVTLAALSGSDSVRTYVTELYVRPSTNMTFEAIDRQLGKAVTRYITPHEEVNKSLASHQYDADRIAIIPNAIGPSDLNKESARRRLIQLGGFGDHINIAGAVAPLVPRSRLKDLIWATDLLTCVRDDVHFFIFGRGPQRRRLERFASQTEAGDHVHFVDSEIHGFELIPGLNFFWQSHLNEPLPGAMHHAMQNTVPVVSVFGPGTSETIVPQETGFATNFGARDEFARWTKFLLEQSQPSVQLAEQGRASLNGKFSVAEMAEGYLALYSDSEVRA